MAAFKKSITVDGVDYDFVINMAAMRAVESEMEKKSGEVLQGLGEISMEGISCLFWAGLQTSTKMTREGSDSLLDVYGFTAALELVQEGIVAYLGTAPKGKGGKAAASPPAETETEKTGES
jgi:hypothetical protein